MCCDITTSQCHKLSMGFIHYPKKERNTIEYISLAATVYLGVVVPANVKRYFKT